MFSYIVRYFKSYNDSTIMTVLILVIPGIYYKMLLITLKTDTYSIKILIFMDHRAQLTIKYFI